MIPANESTIRFAAFLTVLLLMLLWQLLSPRRVAALSGCQRSRLHNLSMSLVNAVALRFLMPVTAVATALWAEAKGYGLLAGVPVAANLLLGILLLDVAIYWQHRWMHIVPLLWRLHRVHHSDTAVDVTTALRFHPAEILLSMAYKIALVFLLGIQPLTVIVFELLLNLLAMFNHSNVNLPFDRSIRRLLVTPDMHRVHHSVHERETNSNYGFFLPLWDRLFGSYVAQPRDGHIDMQLGLNYFRNNEDQKITQLLIQPFKRDEPE